MYETNEWNELEESSSHNHNQLTAQLCYPVDQTDSYRIAPLPLDKKKSTYLLTTVNQSVRNVVDIISKE
jgi:hypothetical protein